MLPSKEELEQLESKPRPLHVEPWVLASLSRLWQQRKAQIRNAIVSGKLAPPHTDQSAPASARNRS